ncbi:hypothetical protein Agub_g12138 [Astrephomene gubernaculifera]|uniref:Rieske domain-containing protein n=1 Tax=Astrephomene gubernaculifera TaxID=47775 RepID=A0AAD3E019_9CHLO|nr:hypothetical protein Agub_g12138 [Astrephomene gubernaculifera]
MTSTTMMRQVQAVSTCPSVRSPVPTVALARPARRQLPAGGFAGPKSSQHRPQLRVFSQKDEHKVEPSTNPPPPTESAAESPFFEPLLRGLVLGVGAGVLCEMAHVAFKFTNIATDGGSHFPSGAQIYEQLAPLFVWDHAVAITFWFVFYIIEAAAILAILREYPDDKQASKVIGSTITLPKRLMPLKLSSVKKALHTLVSGRSLQLARQGAAPMAYRGGSSGGAAVLEKPRPVPTPRPLNAPKVTVVEEEESKTEGGKTAQEGGPACKGRAAAVRGGSLSAEFRRAAGLRPGQLSPDSPLFDGKTPVNPKDIASAKREKELRDRKAYLQNFWYAAAVSEKVTSKPMRVDILSRTVTIWRGEDGKVHCLDDVCPHRGAPLSSGWTKEKNGKSCVVCPYHGWTFNGEGALEEVPSQQTHLAFPRRPLVDSYPVEERGGFVWLFFGAKGLPADERPPLPLVPELEDPNWRAVYGEMEFESPHWPVFENAMDFAHIHYVHDGSFGNQDKPTLNDMTVTRDTWSVSANFNIHNKPVNPLWNFTKVPSVPVEARAFLPSTSSVKITLGGGVQMITYVNTVPIDEHRTINRFCLIRNFATSPLFDAYTRKNMYKILTEDKVMIEMLKPEQLLNEVSLEADKPQIAFRKLRQEWLDMGYGVQPEANARHTGSLRVDM